MNRKSTVFRAVVYYLVAGVVAACAMTVVTVPYSGAAAGAAAVDAVMVTGWLAGLAVDAVATRMAGGRR